MSFIKRKPFVVCDIEVAPNAYLIGFKSVEKGKVIQIGIQGEDAALDKDQRKKVRSILSNYTIVTFNGERYDIPVILYSLYGRTCSQIFKVSTEIIQENKPQWKSLKDFGIEAFPNLAHIDISDPTPGVMIGLKMYMARIHSKKIQDLPYEYDKHLTDEEYKLWCEYNVNDLDGTIDLFNLIQDPIELRYNMSEMYKADLMSRGDAQIAEHVIVHELKKRKITAKKVNLSSKYTVQYKAPSCIEFKTPEIQEILEKIQEEKIILDGKGSPKIPDWLKKEVIVIGDTKYNIGLGGLHSQEKKLVVVSDENNLMRNADVGSYYPSMIIEYGFYPKQYGEDFLDIYKDIYTTRLAAKKSGDKGTSESLKLVLNGTFGKFGNKYSKIYSPDLMLQVTFTGQLLLLMLIEELELKDFRVVSSNTDGIEYYCNIDRQDEAEAIIFDWELTTGMNMEHGIYKALYARDVNNYVALYDNQAKAKGCYLDTSLPIPLPRKNREYDIVYFAIKAYLLEGIPFRETIENTKDIRQFLVCKKVTGGAKWREQYLGKVVRWYYSTDGDPILYVKANKQGNHNKVGKSDNAKPLMQLPDDFNVPDDLDFEYYIELCIKHLEDTGVEYDAE